jgi:hypothetical protein
MTTVSAHCRTYREAAELSNDISDIDDERFTHGIRGRTVTIVCEDGNAGRWVRQLESDSRVESVAVG